MAISHMTPRGAGYTTAVNKAPAYSAGVVGYTGFRGTAALPAYAWEEDPDTGVYSSAANNLDLSTGGSVRANVSSAGVSVTGAVVGSTQFSAAVGTKTVPSYSFTGDLDTGVFSSAANEVAVSTADTLRATFSSTGLAVVAAVSATTSVTATTDLFGDIGLGANVIWIPAAMLPDIYFTTGTWTVTRGAAGDYYRRRSASSDVTSTLEYPLSHIWTKSTASKGFQLLGLRYVYAIATNAVTSHTYDILDTVYAHGAAPVVGTAWGGTLTGTLSTATTTNNDVIAITTGTDSYITDLTGLHFQVTVDFTASATVYDAYGIFVDGNFTA